MRTRWRRRQQAIEQRGQAIDFRTNQRDQLALLLVAYTIVGATRQQLRSTLEPGQRIAQFVGQALERSRKRAGQGQGRILAGEFVYRRSEEHTSELQSLMRISYAVFCLKKKKTHTRTRRTSAS